MRVVELTETLGRWNWKARERRQIFFFFHEDLLIKAEAVGFAGTRITI